MTDKRSWEEIMQSPLSKEKVFTTSGARNYFAGNAFTGDGYLYHEAYKLLHRGFNFQGATHISKTTLWGWNDGNMPWNQKTLRPSELFPKCIHIDWKKKLILNAVGLSGPGLEDLGARGVWQKRKERFFISIMVIADTPEKRLDQIMRIYWWLKTHLHEFAAEVGIEVNITCPNTQHSPLELAGEVIGWLRILSKLGIHIRVKLNLEIPNETIRGIANSGFCHSLSLTNTAKFGSVPDLIDWEDLFDGQESPLILRGLKQPGGLSGWPLLKPGLQKLSELRLIVPQEIPIYYGGGLEYASQVEMVKKHGGSGIVIGATMIMFHPNEVQPAIQAAHRIF